VVIEKARVFVKQLVDIYYDNFELKDQANYANPNSTKKKH
jgi:hypothetical protein